MNNNSIKSNNNNLISASKLVTFSKNLNSNANYCEEQFKIVKDKVEEIKKEYIDLINNSLKIAVICDVSVNKITVKRKEEWNNFPYIKMIEKDIIVELHNNGFDVNFISSRSYHGLKVYCNEMIISWNNNDNKKFDGNSV
jgi:hypothetical protein